MNKKKVIILKLISIVLFFNCTTNEGNEIKKIISNYGSDEILVGGRYCEEFFNPNGTKQKIICYQDENKSSVRSYLQYLYSETGNILKLKYKNPYNSDTVFYDQVNTNTFCIESRDKEWKVCFDSTWRKVRSTHLYINDLQQEIYSEFGKFKYDVDGNVLSELTYSGESDIQLGKFFYIYTKFDENNNWIERESYGMYESLDDDEGVNIHSISDSQKQSLLNGFSTGPVGEKPRTQQRKIIYR